MSGRPRKGLTSPRLAAAATLAALLLAAVARAAEPLPDHKTRSFELASAISAVPGTYTAGPNLSPADPHPIPAVDCVNQCPPGYEATWKALGLVDDFQQWAQGEYVGRARLPHVPVYRLRVDDALEFQFRVDHNRMSGQYKINVGDELLVESVTASELTRTLLVLPDGKIALPLIGLVDAAGRTSIELRDDLQKKFKTYYQDPSISVNLTRPNSKLEELRTAIAGQIGFAKQTLPGRVTPEGTVQLPAVGSVPAQGLTIEEFKTEVEERLAEEIEGVEVIPSLQKHGPRYVYVLGEVRQPGRYTLEAPTTVMQAISMAGSWTVGAKITHVVVFRRADDWRLLATRLDMRAALLGRTPCPDGEIWVSDSDLIIVPKSRILRADNFIELVFTRGIYGVVPINFSVSYSLFKNAIPPFLIIP
jgi:polysaccharide export outer membrane protein